MLELSRPPAGTAGGGDLIQPPALSFLWMDTPARSRSPPRITPGQEGGEGGKGDKGDKGDKGQVDTGKGDGGSKGKGQRNKGKGKDEGKGNGVDDHTWGPWR